MKTSRQIQAEKTKGQILDCYLELIREKPIDEIKIADLCKKADISVGTYYHYFRSKESIIREIYYRIDARFEEIGKHLCGKTYVDQILEYLTHTGDEAQNYFGLRASTTIYRLQMSIDADFFLDTSRPFSQNLLRLLTLAVKAGELSEDIQIQTTVIDLLCIFRGIVYSWCLLKGEFDVEDMIHTTVKAYLKKITLLKPTVS